MIDKFDKNDGLRIFSFTVFAVLIINLLYSMLLTVFPSLDGEAGFWCVNVILQASLAGVVALYCKSKNISFFSATSLDVKPRVADVFLTLGAGAGTLAFMLPLQNFIVNWFEWMGFEVSVSVPVTGTAGNVVLLIVVACIMPAFCEELVFRGALGNGLAETGLWSASLLGGALFYSENYVKQNKNTLYFKKWNVMNGLEDVGEGQYMTNVQGAESEAAALRKGYLSLLDSPMIFEIPIYSGMPDAACRKPSGNNASSQPELPKEEEPKIKKEQTVTTNYTRYTRKVTDKGFNLNAKTDGDGVLTYASSDDRIASVDQSGQVRVNGVEGVVTFTVSASETETCKAGSKIVTLTVKKSEAQQEAERLQKMLTLADAIRLKASSTKNAGGSIQVKLTITQGDIAAIEDLGYTVKYKYYRSEKKNADYRSKVEKQTMTPYVNTAGIKNTRYYYKSRVMIYDADGSLAAYTRLDRCSYACRIWTKE